MNKRLEEIKDYTGYPYNDNLEEWIVWLIDQAERVQEWRDIAKWQNDEKLKMEKIALEYEKQNKRYREAIQKACDELNRQSGAVNDLGQVNINKDLLQIFLILNKTLEGEE